MYFSHDSRMVIKQSQAEEFFKHLIKQMQERTPCLRCIRIFSKCAGIDEKKVICEILQSDIAHDSSFNIKASSNVGDKLDICSIPAERRNVQAQQMFIDFANQKLIEGEKQIPIPKNQPWLLLEHGIQKKTINYLNGFFLFDWTAEITNPKRRFATIVSKANNLIPALRFSHMSRKADIWELNGLEETKNYCNITQTENLLQTALNEIKNGKDWNSVIDKIIQAFELDPKYLNLAFCVVEIITNVPNIVFPPEMLKNVYNLLQKEQARYQKGIHALEHCMALADADIKDYLKNCHAKLAEITKSLEILLQYLRNNNLQVLSDNPKSEISLCIEKMRLSCNSMKEVFVSKEFQELCNRKEIQNVCNAVIRRLLKFSKGLDYDDDYFKEAFKQHFAQLILYKVDFAKLNTPFSLAAYCQKTILPELRDKVCSEKYGMSYKMYIAISQKRRVTEQLYHSLGNRPTDTEIIQEMKISLDRLHEIRSAEESLSHYSFENEWDSSADNDNEDSCES